MWEALGPFIGLFDFLRGVGERRSDRTRVALAALSKSLFETRMYLRDLENGAPSDQARENDIVRLWSSAATELRDLDENLAVTCQYKAEYWLQPDGWTAETIEKRGIGIDRLFEKFRAVLPVPGARLD